MIRGGKRHSHVFVYNDNAVFVGVGKTNWSDSYGSLGEVNDFKRKEKAWFAYGSMCHCWMLQRVELRRSKGEESDFFYSEFTIMGCMHASLIFIIRFN